MVRSSHSLPQTPVAILTATDLASAAEAAARLAVDWSFFNSLN